MGSFNNDGLRRQSETKGNRNILSSNAAKTLFPGIKNKENPPSKNFKDESTLPDRMTPEKKDLQVRGNIT